MMNKIKRFFKKLTKRKFSLNFKPSYTPILPELKDHFENDKEGYKENKSLQEKLLKKLKPNSKTIFLIDDNCYITQMLEEELHKRLISLNKDDEFSVISICKPTVGFDFLTFLLKNDIKPDYMIIDIEFGKIETINDKKIKIDGVDLAIESKILNPKLNYVLFTGNVITGETSKNYSFVEKFEKFFGDSISNHVVIKDTALNFEYSMDIFTIICKDLNEL